MKTLKSTAIAHPNIAFIKYWGNRDHGAADEMLLTRFVCDWSVPYDELDKFLAVLKAS